MPEAYFSKYGASFSGGQKQVIRLAQRVTSQSKKIKLEISKYIAHTSVVKEYLSIPQIPLSFDEIKDPNSDIYSNCKDKISRNGNDNDLLFETKRRILELKDLQERCVEEREMLSLECQALFKNRLKQLSDLESARTELLSNDSLEEKGEQAKGEAALNMRLQLSIQKGIWNNERLFTEFKCLIPETVKEPSYHFLAELFFEQQKEQDDETDSSGSESEDDDIFDCDS